MVVLQIGTARIKAETFWQVHIELIDSLILQRQALKISQRELASAAGVSWTEVALMEQKKHMVQLRALLRIAAALNCKLVAVSVE